MRNEERGDRRRCDLTCFGCNDAVKIISRLLDKREPMQTRGEGGMEGGMEGDKGMGRKIVIVRRERKINKAPKKHSKRRGG